MVPRALPQAGTVGRPVPDTASTLTHSLAIALDRQARADEGVRRLSEQVRGRGARLLSTPTHAIPAPAQTEQLEQRKRDLELRAAELRTKHQVRCVAVSLQHGGTC